MVLPAVCGTAVALSVPGVAAAVTTYNDSVYGLEHVRANGSGSGRGSFAVLVLLVRMRWVPLEAVDRDVAASLNRAVAPHPVAVKGMRLLSTLGSHAVLGWLIVIASVLLDRAWPVPARVVSARDRSGCAHPRPHAEDGRLSVASAPSGTTGIGFEAGT
jgi:hypothetical protein